MSRMKTSKCILFGSFIRWRESTLCFLKIIILNNCWLETSQIFFSPQTNRNLWGSSMCKADKVQINCACSNHRFRMVQYWGSGICDYSSNPGVGRRGFHSLVLLFFFVAPKESSCQSHNANAHSCSHSRHHHYLSCLLHLRGRNHFLVKFLQTHF